MSLGYITNKQNDSDNTAKFFKEGWAVSRQVRDREAADQCACNYGIAAGNVELENFKESIKGLDWR